MKKLKVHGFCLFCSLGVLLIFSNGCATPSTSESRNVPVDSEDWGGIQSVDIRTVASTMSVELLSTPEIAGHEGRVNVAIEPMVNSTRFIFDKDIFTEKLRLELMKVAKDKISFQANLGQKTRMDRQRLIDEKQLDRTLDSIAEVLAKTPLISEAREPLKFAVIPVANTNIIGMNAESVTALLRSKILEKSAGKVQFLARDKNGKSIDQILNEKDLKSAGLVKGGKFKEMYGVDFFIGGEFIAKALEVAVKREGGESPNLDKYFNVMLIDAETGGVAFEKSVKIETKVDSGVDRADYILTGELKGLSNVANRGDRSDYILVSLQLIDPQSNNIVWTNGYEVKRMTKVSDLYK